MKVDARTSNNPSALQDSLARAQQGNAATAASTASTASSTASSSAPTADSSGDSGNVSLSGLSSSLRSLAASGSADIDVNQVEAIKAAISNGTLQIDPGKIADGVLETARSLLQAPSGT